MASRRWPVWIGSVPHYIIAGHFAHKTRRFGLSTHSKIAHQINKKSNDFNTSAGHFAQMRRVIDQWLMATVPRRIGPQK
jgi:hypothetical protein